jgi:DNA-binding CsgD family transcriptional regulator
MQMQLPLFPTEVKLINNTVGFFEKGEQVYYLHNGSPIYCHNKSDLNNYRYITANLVETGLCQPSEIARALGVSARNIQRYAKSLREKGASWFFNRQDNRGQCYKLKEDILESVQDQINENIPISQIALQYDVTEGAIRYHVRTGKLKKTKK